MGLVQSAWMGRNQTTSELHAPIVLQGMRAPVGHVCDVMQATLQTLDAPRAYRAALAKLGREASVSNVQQARSRIQRVQRAKIALSATRDLAVSAPSVQTGGSRTQSARLANLAATGRQARVANAQPVCPDNNRPLVEHSVKTVHHCSTMPTCTARLVWTA